MSSQAQSITNQLRTFTGFTSARLATDIINELKIATPIRSGWANANWIPYIGAPREVPVGDKSPGGVDAARVVQNTSLSLLAVYNVNAGSIFITNNVPYIDRLNSGSSAQAPAGFVQNSFALAIFRNS